jgi:transposase
VSVSDEDREVLERWLRRRKSSQALAQRARIVLAAGEGLSNTEIAARERVVVDTVRKWRRRFADRGLDGLLDEPRVGAPRKIDDATVERVIVTTLEERPKDATHWSTRCVIRAMSAPNYERCRHPITTDAGTLLRAMSAPVYG